MSTQNEKNWNAYHSAVHEQAVNWKSFEEKKTAIVDYVEEHFESMPSEIQTLFNLVCEQYQIIVDTNDRIDELHEAAKATANIKPANGKLFRKP